MIASAFWEALDVGGHPQKEVGVLTPAMAPRLPQGVDHHEQFQLGDLVISDLPNPVHPRRNDSDEGLPRTHPCWLLATTRGTCNAAPAWLEAPYSHERKHSLFESLSNPFWVLFIGVHRQQAEVQTQEGPVAADS